jgi:hypothetical protein
MPAESLGPPGAIGWSGRAQAEEVPGFPVFFEVASVFFSGAFGVEADVDQVYDLCDGDDVPSVVGDNIADDEVDFVGGVFDVAAEALAGYGDGVSPALAGEDGLHLDAEEAVALSDYEVVGFAITVGFADGESHAEGFEDEDQFGHLAFAFGIVGDQWSGLAAGVVWLFNRERLVCHIGFARRVAPSACVLHFY